MYRFTVIHVMKVSGFFPRKSRGTSWNIWSPTTSLEKVWRYEKLVFQANQCCFRDLENSRGQFFLLIEGFQARHMDLMQLVIGENGFQCNVRSQLSLIIVEGQYSEANSE